MHDSLFALLLGTNFKAHAQKGIPSEFMTHVSDDLFRSGPWVGFYNYGPGDWHRLDLHLDFR